MADFKVNSISDNTVGTYTFIDYNSGAPIAKVDKMQADTITNEAGTGTPSATYGISFPAGQGLDFSASAGSGATSSIFDDYEEGTFTPTIVGGTTAGTGSYSVQTGFYTKIGDTIHVQIRISWSAHTGTGNLQIGGLPYSASTTANQFSAFNPRIGNILFSSAFEYSIGLVLVGTDLIRIDLIRDNDLPVQQSMVASGEIIISGTYKV